MCASNFEFEGDRALSCTLSCIQLQGLLDITAWRFHGDGFSSLKSNFPKYYSNERHQPMNKMIWNKLDFSGVMVKMVLAPAKWR
jgi:hypothetical protein